MSMKDAIFGTAAPTSHGGATYRDSIQAWLPVKNIIGGVVITKDNRFIKILEVLPVNFYLKSPSDQQNIITSYAAYLRSRTILKRSASASQVNPSGTDSSLCFSMKPKCAPNATPSKASFSV